MYLNNIFSKSIYSTKLTVNVTFQFIYVTGLHCYNKQYIVSGDQYYVPDSKLSASSVNSPGLDVMYSRLTNEQALSGSWTAGVHQDDQFIQVNFIFYLSFDLVCGEVSFIYRRSRKCMFNVEPYKLC